MTNTEAEPNKNTSSSDATTVESDSSSPESLSPALEAAILADVARCRQEFDISKKSRRRDKKKETTQLTHRSQICF